MTSENKEILLKRVKSLLWRVSMMVLAVIVQFILDNLSLVELPPAATVFIGLVLGELSKYLATRNK